MCLEKLRPLSIRCMDIYISSSSVICQTTGPKPLAKWFLHIVRSRASFFNSQYPFLSLRLSSNFLHLLPCLLVTSICPFIFPSITCFRRHFLRKMWPIQLAFCFIISCRLFLCSFIQVTLLHFSHDWSRWSPFFSSTTFQNFPGVSDVARSVQVSAPYRAMLQT